MQISGSIFAVNSNWFEYARSLKDSKVDFIHIDLFDDGQSKFMFNDLLKFDKSYLPLDVHLIYKKVTSADITILNQSHTRYLNIQYENLINKMELSEISKSFQGSLGIALTMETPLETIEEYSSLLSQVLIMCSTPGVSGAKFDERNLERILLIRERYPTLPIFADGGINDVIAEEMNRMGVSLVVSGSYLARQADDLCQYVYSLKFSNESNIPVRRIMVPISQLPVVDMNADFMTVMDIMNSYRLGTVFVKHNDIFKGIITDGDVRRCYLKYRQELFSKLAGEILNSASVWVNSDSTMENVFHMLSESHKGIDVVPVLEKHTLIGAIDLHIGK